MAPPPVRPPRRRRSRLLAAVALAGAALLLATPAARAEPEADNWAVIVSSSRYWLNYRHTANALGIYQAVRRLGIPDDRILLMLADQHACSPRNPHPGAVFLAPGGPSPSAGAGAGTSGAGRGRGLDPNLLPADADVDYRGREVNVEAVLRVLTGRHAPGTPPSKRLRSGPRSRVLLYLTGHGGDEFLKFHDQEELLAADLAAALAQAHAAGRYGELLLVADTCQASTLYSRLAAPNVLAVASSKLGQSSYAHRLDTHLGLHVADQMTFHLHAFLTARLPPHPAASGAASNGQGGAAHASAATGPSLQQLLDYVSGQRLSSEVQVRSDLHPRRPADVPVAHFFGGAEAGARRAGAARAAAAALQSQAAQPGGQGADGAPAAATAATALAAMRQQPASGAQLFALLEAAGGSRGWGRSSHGISPAAAATAAAWAGAAVLLVKLMK